MAGRWEGELEQRGLEPFRVEAEIRSPSRSGEGNVVGYSGIDCSGRWEYLGKEGDVFRFREVIEPGQGGKCKGVGIVSLVRLGTDRLRYEFRRGGIVSRGVLSPMR